MADKRKKQTARPAAKRTSKSKRAKASKAVPESRKKSSRGAAAPAPKRAPRAKKIGGEAKKPAAKSVKRAKKSRAEEPHRAGEPVLDPVGDVTSGEAKIYLGDGKPEIEVEGPAATEMEAFRKETQIEASDAILEAGPGREAAQEALEERARRQAKDTADAEAEPEERAETEPAQEQSAQPEAVKLERLQKILSQAGIASRRRAEEMIMAGRVMVNGQVVTQLGSKADAARDHIRVDGKLLHGAERHRYFVLNKPRGYVTTANDPEGRPTVMQFFTKTGERLYPVGRLDYQSEGLLLMTNDGTLANLLTKAGSGVEKTYLVKVAGAPTAEQLDRLREGVKIEKGAQGSERVRTAPAQIRQVRQGENPWFEVVLVEGRNRELRKMFAAIGHFAEKIRRVGYGPLALDLEPGKFRELTAEEVNALRLTAEGKMQPRRMRTERMLPANAGRVEEKRDRFADRRQGRGEKRQYERTEPAHDRDNEKQAGRGERPRWQREHRGPQKEWRPRGEEFRGAGRQERGENRNQQRGSFKPRGERPELRGGQRRERGENRSSGLQRGPFNSRGGPRSGRPEFRGGPKGNFGGGAQRERGGKRFGEERRGPLKPRGERPAWGRGGEAKPRGEFSQRREGGKGAEASEFRGKAKPAFGAKPKFGGNARAAFGSKPKFGGKPGGFGKFRGAGRGGRKFGGSRPGAQRGGWKRG